MLDCAAGNKSDTDDQESASESEYGPELEGHGKLCQECIGLTILVGALALVTLGAWEVSSERVEITWWLLQRAVAFASLTQFASWLWQVVPLVGEKGLAPAFQNLDAMPWRTRLHAMPSVFHLCSTDTSLMTACLLGVVASLALLSGQTPHLLELMLWLVSLVLHLSLAHAVSPFSLTTEEMFCELSFLMIVGCMSSSGHIPIVAWRWLCFRFHLGAGLVKKFGSHMWADGTAMLHHYYNQPLPNCLSRTFHRMPQALHVASVYALGVVQIAGPFAIYAPWQAVRLCVGAAFVGLQIMINSSGNYGNLGLTTVVLCLALLDDDAIKWICNSLNLQWMASGRPVGANFSADCDALAAGILLVHGALSVVPTLWTTKGFVSAPSCLAYVHASLGGWVICNRYGPFGAMHDFRHEIIVEGSADGVDWHTYPFFYKPYCAEEHPRCIGFFYWPRFDWRLWFLPLYEQQAMVSGYTFRLPLWFQKFLHGLVEGSPHSLVLLPPEAARHPVLANPRFVRASIYDFSFAEPGEEACWHLEGPLRVWVVLERPVGASTMTSLGAGSPPVS